MPLEPRLGHSLGVSVEWERLANGAIDVVFDAEFNGHWVSLSFVRAGAGGVAGAGATGTPTPTKWPRRLFPPRPIAGPPATLANDN